MFDANRIVFILITMPLFCFSQMTLNLTDLPLEISSEEHPLQNQQIRVRGFWYPLSEKKGVLSAQPDLKSCCVQSPSLTFQKISVAGEVGKIPARAVVTLEGIFKIELLYNDKHELMPYYLLEQAREVVQNSFSVFYLMSAAILLLLMIGIGKILIKKRAK